MNAEELRAVQGPIKARFKDDPGAALRTLRVTGRLDPARQSCTIDVGGTPVVAGLHPAVGGDGSSVCSGDLLLASLATCAGVTLGAVVTALGLDVRGGTVSAEGDLDFRGTLGVAKDVPVGFLDIRLTFDLDADLTDDQRANLLRLTERYCVIYQTIRSGCKVSATVAPAVEHS